ncbi:MAG: NADH-quinone oxidoreductase subunit J, partial [Bryocella sp.]
CVVAGSTFAVLAWAILRSNIATPTSPLPSESTTQIGNALMHSFALPLEIMGILLTAALIGAVIIAMPQSQSRSAK